MRVLFSAPSTDQMHSLSFNVRYFLWPANYVPPSSPNFDSSVVSLGSSLWLPIIWTSCTIKFDGYSTADVYIAVIILMLLGAILFSWFEHTSLSISLHAQYSIFSFARPPSGFILPHIEIGWLCLGMHETSMKPYVTGFMLYFCAACKQRWSMLWVHC